MRYCSDHEFLSANAFISHSINDSSVTDAVVSMWRHAGNEKNILESVGESKLWDYCFLILVDDYPECSVIIDHGGKAGQTLCLEAQAVKNLGDLPSSLAQPIHALGLKCKNSGMPVFGVDVTAVAENDPGRLSGMAFLPLDKADHHKVFLYHDPAIILGVLGCQ